MIIPTANEQQAFGPSMIIILSNPLSSNLMRGYDLVVTITISFKRPNNLKDLISELREERRDQSIDRNPPTDFIKSLNQIRVMLIELASRSVTLINLNGISSFESLINLIKT